ncbi:MAG: glycosyltransferase family 4 protein [Candidatus Promineifilaceae bacterium]
MHIAHITRIVWGHGIHGGMEQHSRLLLNGLRERGHRVTTITTAGAPPAKDLLSLEKARAIRYSRGWWRESAIEAAALHQRDPIDVVWSQGVAGRSVWRALDVPSVTILHGTIETEWRTRRQNLRSLRGALQAARFLWAAYGEEARWREDVTQLAHIIGVSDEVATSMITRCNARQEKTSVVANGIDTNVFKPAERPPNKQRHLITAGRLRREKGVQLALDALQQIPNTVLLVAGDGRDLAWLQAYAKQCGVADRVRFLGMLDQPTLARQLQSADLFLLPTLRYEGLPMSLIEAMASGLPIVATDVGGIAAAIDDGENGLLFPIGDTPALVGQIQRVLGDADFGRKLATNARAKALSHFSVERMIDQTEAILVAAGNQS